MSKKRRSKFGLGKISKEGYEYSTKIDLSNNLEVQIEQLMNEKKANDVLVKEVELLRKAVKVYEDQQKLNSRSYYYKIGKLLDFMDKDTFSNVKKTSILRRVYELLPETLPSALSSRVAIKHMLAMYYLGKTDKRDLGKAKWWQWYELTKFPKLFTVKKHYKKVLEMLRDKKGGVRALVPKRFRN